ncbi:MAG: polysaccharide biosynthesis protein [Alphaproteobacteria bacterium]
MLVFINKIDNSYKKIIKILFDIFFSFLSLFISFIFFIKDITIVNYIFDLSLQHYLFFLIILLSFLPIFFILRIYQFIYRYFNIYNYLILILSFLFIFTVNYFSSFFLDIIFLNRYFSITRLIVSQSVIFLFFAIIFRYSIVLILKINKTSQINKNILIYGAGNAGNLLIPQLNQYNIRGFIDDDINKSGKYIGKYKIYSSSEINNLIKDYSISLILVSIPSLNNDERFRMLNKLKNLNVLVKILPRIDDIKDGNLSTDELNFLPSDLIKRKIKYNFEGIKDSIKDKNILVTGAGGSIGSELTRQIVYNNPKKIILIDNSEYNLFNIGNEIESLIANKELQTRVSKCLISIKEKDVLELIFKKYHLDIIFHAAAYKHVHLLEENINSAFNNNILGSMNLIDLSVKYKIKKFIFISTDKAVKPKSVMGFTKHIIEQIIFKQISNDDNKTFFSIVRFGNVINSKGSVIPLFQKQIENGGPVTITHPEVQRYFMTIPEASILVLESSILTLGKGVYVLNMGEPIKIIDLANKIANLYGKKLKDGQNPNGDIEIKFIGLRKGEKIDEDLYYNNKNLIKTLNDDIFFEKLDTENPKIDKIMEDINYILKTGNSELINKFINDYSEKLL